MILLSAEIGHKRQPKSIRIHTNSVQNRPRVDQRPPKSDLGPPWGSPSGKSSKVAFLNKTGCQNVTPFGIDFAWFHNMKLTKQGFGRVATTRMHVKKVAFSSGRY